MNPIFVGKAVTTPNSGNVVLLPQYGNRHGLVAGATGTGKTVTLMTLAEGFSRLGVPVFLADVKGDVAGLAMPEAAAKNCNRALHNSASPTTEQSRTRGVLGLVGQGRAPGAHHRERNGPHVAGPHPGTQ